MKVIAALVVLSVTWLALSARGQAGTGEIVGSVRDTTGAVLPGVKLTLTHRTRAASSAN